MGQRRKIIERTITYDPLPSQKRFHWSTARFKGFSGPLGSGKSMALCQEAIRLAYINVGRTGLMGAPTYTMLRDVTQAAFFEICDRNRLPYKLIKASGNAMLEDTGSKILFRSMDEAERLRGTTLAWFGVDELTYVSEDAWTRLEARLRDPKAKELCGFGVWTPKGFDWVHRRFKDKPVPGYELIEAQPFENRHLLAQVPDYYDRLKASYDARFFEQEVLGQYLNLTAGKVYHQFDRQENTGHFQLDPRWPLIWSWDFNLNPMCSVICQQQDGRVLVLDEIVIPTSSTPEMCDEFLARFGNHRSGVMIYGDASGEHGQTATGNSDFDLVREFFARRPELDAAVTVRSRNPAVRDRLNVVNGRLQNADGQRLLLVDVKCKELIQDFEQVCFKEGTGQIDKEKDPRRTHLSDALGYFLWDLFRPRATVGEKSGRIT